jgi:hypothetical protein
LIFLSEALYIFWAFKDALPKDVFVRCVKNIWYPLSFDDEYSSSYQIVNWILNIPRLRFWPRGPLYPILCLSRKKSDITCSTVVFFFCLFLAFFPFVKTHFVFTAIFKTITPLVNSLILLIADSPKAICDIFKSLLHLF